MILIAGAGIGGLTLAVALKRRGVAVTVLERETEIRPAGSGLALSPNAMLDGKAGRRCLTGRRFVTGRHFSTGPGFGNQIRTSDTEFS